MATSFFDAQIDRISAGERLTADEIRELARTPDILPLGMLADALRRRLHGTRATFVRVAACAFDQSIADAVPPAARELRLTGSPESLDSAVSAVQAAKSVAGVRTVAGFSWADAERWRGVEGQGVLVVLAGEGGVAEDVARVAEARVGAGRGEQAADRVRDGTAVAFAVEIAEHGERLADLADRFAGVGRDRPQRVQRPDGLVEGEERRVGQGEEGPAERGEHRKLVLRPVWSFARVVIRERRQIFTRRRTALLLALVVAVVGPWFVRWPVLVDAGFVVVPNQRADVRSQTAGRVVEILVKEGDRVRRGQPLATLRNAGLHARVEQLAAELEAASHRVAELRAGARDEEIALARSGLARARSENRLVTSNAEVATRLAEASLVPQASAEAARDLASASASASVAMQWELALLTAGTRREDITVAEAVHARIASQLAHLRAEQLLLTLRSPIDGTIVAPHLDDKLQMMLAPGDLFAEVHDTSSVIAEISLTLGDPLAEIAVGDDVELRPYGAPHGEAHARVERVREVAQASTDPDSRRIVIVTSPFALQHPVSGLTGHARIYGAEHSLAYANLYLPLQRLIHVRLWSMW